MKSLALAALAVGIVGFFASTASAQYGGSCYRSYGYHSPNVHRYSYRPHGYYHSYSYPRYNNYYRGHHHHHRGHHHHGHRYYYRPSGFHYHNGNFGVHFRF